MEVVDSSLTNETGNVFRTTRPGYIWVDVSGTFAGTIDLDYGYDNSTFSAFKPDGTAATYTAAGSYVYYVGGGLYFRFESTNAGDSVDTKVDGDNFIMVAEDTSG